MFRQFGLLDKDSVKMHPARTVTAPRCSGGHPARRLEFGRFGTEDWGQPAWLWAIRTIPKGLNHAALGCEGRATLGESPPRNGQP